VRARHCVLSTDHLEVVKIALGVGFLDQVPGLVSCHVWNTSVVESAKLVTISGVVSLLKALPALLGWLLRTWSLIRMD